MKALAKTSSLATASSAWAIALLLTGCATHSMTFHNGPKNRTVTQVHENPMHLSLFNGMVEPNSVRLDEECGVDDWVRIDQDDSFVNRMVADKTDGTITPKSITVHCGPYDRPMAPVAAPMPQSPPLAGAPGAASDSHRLGGR